MGIFENRSLVSSDRLKRLLLFVLFLLSGLMLLVGCHEDQEEEVISSIYNEDDLKYEDSLKQYLRNTYPSVINKVSVTESSIEIVGNCVGEGHFYLGANAPNSMLRKPDPQTEDKRTGYLHRANPLPARRSAAAGRESPAELQNLFFG